MSEEQLKTFLEALKADVGLQEKLKAANDADAVVAIAKDAGYLISVDDLKQAQAEVSDKELEGAAGGRSTWLAFICFPGAEVLKDGTGFTCNDRELMGDY